RHFRPFGLPFGITGEDDVPPSGQKARQAVEGLAPHDHGRALGVLDEAAQIFFYAPRNLSFDGNGPVIGARHDKYDLSCRGTRPAHRQTRVTWPILRPLRASALP